MLLTRRTSSMLVLAGLWPLLVWPNFIRVVATDPRAFDGGPTAYLIVHVTLAVVSMATGAAVVAVGVRGWRRAARTAGPETTGPETTGPERTGPGTTKAATPVG